MGPRDGPLACPRGRRARRQYSECDVGRLGPIRAGEWIVEQPATIHQAANRGSAPVVIYLATLLKRGVPPATPVTLPAGS